ncbi:MAG: hypothetical protein ACLRM8_00560 [Alistipes sp.]
MVGRRRHRPFDTKYLTGSHPAVCGWELSNIELDMETNIDGSFSPKVRKHIIAAFGRGAVIRFRGIAPIRFGRKLVGRDARRLFDHSGRREPRKFKGWLDKVADFMLSLKSPEGDLFR